MSRPYEQPKPVAAPRLGRTRYDKRPATVHDLACTDDGLPSRRALCGMLPAGSWERRDGPVTCEKCQRKRAASSTS